MAKYAVLLNFTDEGIEAIGESIDRAASFQAMAAKAGARVDTVYWTLGAFDGLFVLDAPDEATAAAIVLRLGQSHKVRTTMLRAFDADEFRGVVGKMPR